MPVRLRVRVLRIRTVIGMARKLHRFSALR
jgi:hypothetical protein